MKRTRQKSHTSNSSALMSTKNNGLKYRKLDFHLHNLTCSPLVGPKTSFPGFSPFESVQVLADMINGEGLSVSIQLGQSAGGLHCCLQAWHLFSALALRNTVLQGSFVTARYFYFLTSCHRRWKLRADTHRPHTYRFLAEQQVFSWLHKISRSCAMNGRKETSPCQRWQNCLIMTTTRWGRRWEHF